MHQNYPKNTNPGPQVAYQPFSNEEISPSSAEWQNSPDIIQQGIPVGSPGNPVMSYPAPMSHFEVASSPVMVSAVNDPAYAKLETWPYLLYKYWVLVSISAFLFGTAMICLRLGFSDQFAWELLNFGVHIWWVIQLVFVFEAISKRSEPKIDKALKLMKIFALVLWIFTFIHMTRTYSGRAWHRLLKSDGNDDSDDRSDDRDDNERSDHAGGPHGHGGNNQGFHHGRGEGHFDHGEGAGGIFACETDICRAQYLISAILSSFVAVGLFYALHWYGARKVKQVLQSPRIPQQHRIQQAQRV